MFSGRKAKADDFSLPSQKHKYRSVTAASFCASCSYTLKIEALKIFCSAGRLYLPPRSGKQARTGVWISLAHLQLSTAESTLCCLKGAGSKSGLCLGRVGKQPGEKGRAQGPPALLTLSAAHRREQALPGAQAFLFVLQLCSTPVLGERDLSCATAGWPCVRLWHPHQGLL